MYVCMYVCMYYVVYVCVRLNSAQLFLMLCFAFRSYNFIMCIILH
jgi:hypothetical protein